MKARWANVSLSEVVVLHYGKALSKDQRSPNGEFPVYGANGVMDRADLYLTSGPSLVVGRKGSAGEITRVDEPFWPSDVTYFTEHDRSRIDVDFLHYQLLTLDLPGMARGVKPGINRNDVYNLTIPLPPLEEQRQIVSILDEAFEGLERARANAEANLQNARELFDNFVTMTFSQILDESKMTLEEVCEFITDGTHQTPKYFDSGYLFLSAKNVKDGQLDWEDIRYVDEAQHVAMQRRLETRLGDLLIRKNGAGYGAAALVDREAIFNVYVSLAVLRPKEEVLPEYLLHFANSSIAQEQFKARIKGQGVPNLHLQEIKQVILPVPTDIDVQRDIADRIRGALETVRLVEANYNKKLQDLVDLRQSLLKKAFAGELT